MTHISQYSPNTVPQSIYPVINNLATPSLKTLSMNRQFQMVEKADFKVGVDIEGTVHTVYVLKRPYVDVFLQKMGRIFECVLFTASLAKVFPFFSTLPQFNPL